MELLTAKSYSKDYLQIDRPQPYIDSMIEKTILDIATDKMPIDISDIVYENFKTEIEDYIFNSDLNNLKKSNKHVKKDICIGCTQFIDNLYMKSDIQILENDYRYHQRLNPDIKFVKPGSLRKNIPMILAAPFPSIGDVRTDMLDILDECSDKNIPVHIDGAWITCCKLIDIDFNHPAIESYAVSLSKGLGLGWNRVGIRYSKPNTVDSISIMNDFRMNLRAVVNIGLYFMRTIPRDYLWKTYSDNYDKICKDFKLTPTKSIYLALDKGQPVGLSPLLRLLENG